MFRISEILVNKLEKMNGNLITKSWVNPNLTNNILLSGTTNSGHELFVKCLETVFTKLFDYTNERIWGENFSPDTTLKFTFNVDTIKYDNGKNFTIEPFKEMFLLLSFLRDGVEKTFLQEIVQLDNTSYYSTNIYLVEEKNANIKSLLDKKLNLLSGSELLNEIGFAQSDAKTQEQKNDFMFGQTNIKNADTAKSIYKLVKKVTNFEISKDYFTKFQNVNKEVSGKNIATIYTIFDKRHDLIRDTIHDEYIGRFNISKIHIFYDLLSYLDSLDDISRLLSIGEQVTGRHNLFTLTPLILDAIKSCDEIVEKVFIIEI
jgi:hypothetical protein